MRIAAALAIACVLGTSLAAAQSARTYYGFDKDGYPGDALLPELRQHFTFTGYWLNNPPGMSSNPWVGKRSVVRAAGLGFLILFSGRVDAALKGHDAAALGRADGAAAIAAAKREGFPAGAVIFLDQEEGGALLPEQASYLGAWFAAVGRSKYRAGIYCSGIPAPAGKTMMSTAQDVEARFPAVRLWVWNDTCPPAPGCALPQDGLNPAKSGFSGALVWQYAQSPRREEDTKACRMTYAADGRCYAPGLPRSEESYVDLDVSRSPDPSHGR
ncbi:MAG: glycoside hydrolase domain-containing protein [Acidobacteriaceae bacterium]